MSRYNIRIKTAQTDFIPVEQFTNYYPGSNVKRELVKRYLVSIANVASPEQMKKFCDDFDISRDNYAQVVTLSHDTEFSDILTLVRSGSTRDKIGQILKSDVAKKYFGVSDRYVRLDAVKNLSPELQEAIGYIPGSRKFKFLVPYTGDNEALKKIYDEKRGNFPGLTNLQWYQLLQKPREVESWVAEGNNPDEFKNPAPNAYFSNRIFKELTFNSRLLTLGTSEEQISSMSMQDKVGALQSQINRQLEEYFIFGTVLADTRNEKIKYVGKNPESLPEAVRMFGATIGQWSELISKRYGKYGDITSKFETKAFTNSSIENKARVISEIWDSGYVPSKSKPKFAYTGNDPKSIEKLKENGLYGKPIDADDIKATDYISPENFRQRLSRNRWTQKITEYINAMLSNAPNVDELREQLQKIWNEVLTYSSSKSQMDQILDDTLKPLNETLKDQGITLLDEQNVYAQYQAGETTKNVMLRFDYLVRKGGKIVLAIENQGDQHYIPSMRFDREDPEKSLQKWLTEKLRDKLKLDYCHDHNIPLLYISGYLTTVEYRNIAENLAKDINYYVNLIPQEQQIETPGENRKNQYIAQESNDIDAELRKYAERLIISHFSEFKQPLYAGIEPSRIQDMIHDKKILLSNLLAVYASNFKVNGYNNLDYLKSLNESTDLSQYYRYIDAACARFGYADNQLERMIEQISLGDRIGKNKYKLPDMSKKFPQPIEEPMEQKPVQEMSLRRHKKKKYKIRRLF
jgi:hypothetical protein